VFACFNYFADPARSGEMIHGVCSNYLCDRKPGDKLVMTGPCGNVLLLPENPWSKPIVCVSTGELWVGGVLGFRV
jgi:sulfite reductase alpha subunit-like flavoprotein